MLQGMKDWFAKPFQADMSALGWFQFFGLIIVIMILWGIIMRHIQEGLR